MTQDSIENLFQSIDTIVSARISNLPFDQTIECEITDINNADRGRYIVKYQASSFIAYGDKNAYQKGDIVYVSIPQNDFTLDKFILNKKEPEEVADAKKLPFLNFTKYENLFSPIQQKTEYMIPFTSNGTNTTGQSFSITDFYGSKYAAGFTKLGIKAAMKTSIPYEMASGEYGIEIILRGIDQTNTYKNIENLTDDDITSKYLRLTMADMLGANLYNTLGYCNQEKVFDIANFLILGMQVRIYQNGRFRTATNEGLRNQKLFVTNLQLYLGYDINDFYNTDYQVYLYTIQGYQYNAEFRAKNLFVRFVQLNSKDRTTFDIVTSKLLSPEYKCVWERYNPNLAETSPNSNLASFETFESDTVNATGVTLSSARSRLKHAYVFVARSTINNKVYISNILEFLNMTYISGAELLDIISGFQVEPAEEDETSDYNGKFFIYGQDSSSTNKIISSKIHYLIVNYIPASDETLPSGLQLGDQLTWTIPAINTMLEPVMPEGASGTLEAIYETKEDDTQVLVGYRGKKTITSLSTEGVDPIEHKYKLPYKIKDYYSPTYTNNTITVQLKRGDTGDFTKTQDILFGTSGSQGNEYNMAVHIYRLTDTTEILNAIPISDTVDTVYCCKLSIYDYDNRDIAYDDSEIRYELIDKNRSYLPGNEENAFFKINNPSESINAFTLMKKNSSNFITSYTSAPTAIKFTYKDMEIIYPIAISLSDAYTAISGSTVITYDITGKKPTYTKNSFVINNGNENAIWTIQPQDNASYMPKLSATNELIAPSIYHTGANKLQYSICCTINGSYVWVQPIYMHQNKYPIGMQQPEQNKLSFPNYEIENTLVGRLKEDAGTVSGIVMGDVKQTGKDSMLGLFAFHDNTEFFCIDENGYVYLNGMDRMQTESGGVSITEANITYCTLDEVILKNIAMIGLVTMPDGVNIINSGGNSFFTLDSSGNLSITGNLSLAGDILPINTNSKNLGSSDLKWANVYATTFNGSFNGTATNATNATNASNYVAGGNIYTNLERISTAISNLGGSYTIA